MQLFLFILTLVLPVCLFSSTVSAHAGIHEELEELTKQILEEPDNPDLYIQRGVAYRIHRDWNHALQDFRKALKLDGNHTAVETEMGRAYFDQGMHQQAQVHLDRALARNPDNVRALVTRAKASNASGHPLLATVDYDRAIRAFQSPRKALPEYYLERARCYAAAGDQFINKAIGGLDEGIGTLGNIQTLELYAIELETRRGDVDAALQRLEPLLARSGRKEFLLFKRGEILLGAGRNSEAREAFLAARADIDTLPPQRRHTRMVETLQANIDDRLTALDSQEYP